MKKLLLGTSALIGATAIVASASAAPELTISGNLDFRLVGGENFVTGLAPSTKTGEEDKVAAVTDVGGADRSWDFGRANSVSEIRFRAHGEADSGATYGASIDYRYLQVGNQKTDESYIYIADSWGRVHLGDDDGIADAYVPRADWIATGAYMFNGWDTYLSPRGVDTGDGTKIVYHSTVANGFKFGASLAEESSIGAGNTILTDATSSALSSESGASVGLSEIVEVGIGYTSEAYGVSYTLGAAVQTGSVTEATKNTLSSRQAGTAATDTFLTESNRAIAAEDASELLLGFNLTWGNIQVGGSYADAGDSGVVTVTGADISISTFTGPDASSELSTANSTRDEVSGALTGQLSQGREFYGIGASYDLGGGMKIAFNYGEAEWGTYTGTSQAAEAIVPATTQTAEVAGKQVRFNSVTHTQTLTAFDFGFPIMDGMSGYAGVGISEYEQTNSATGQNALSSESTTYLVGTTVSF